MTVTELPKVEIFTDGACSGNPGPGGWGAILRSGSHTKELSGGAPETTNNRMELLAAIEGLKALQVPSNVDLFTDSRYLHDGITKFINNWQKKGWKTAGGQPVKNIDLWKRLLDVLPSHKISWHWIKGHNGHPGNERADMLARKEIGAYKKASIV